MTLHTKAHDASPTSDHMLAIATAGFVYAPLVLLLVKALLIASL